MSLPNTFSKTPFKQAITLTLAAAMSACNGGSVKFDSANAQAHIDENTAGIFWTAKSQVQGDSKNLTFKISGEDAALFSINPASGELSFKTPADFETPLDVNKDNGYDLNIEVSIAQSSDTQKLRVFIKDVSKPTLSLIKPKPYENVGLGDSLDVETLVQFYDEESNAPIKGSGVTLNTSPLIQDAANPQLWKGKINVPEGGVDLTLAGFLADNTQVKSAGKLFNKRDAINPSYLGVNPGQYLAFFDTASGRGMIGKINLVNDPHYWFNYFQNSILVNLPLIFDWNSRLQTIYVLEPNGGRLFAAGVENSVPSAFFAGHIPGVVNLTYDATATNRRVIVVTKNTESGSNRYRVLALATDDIKGFSNAQTERNSFAPAATQLIWDIPSDIIRGTFKYFNFHSASKTYIISDERSVNNIQQTVVQGFSENGQKKFETTVGGDSSNMAVDQAAGLVYIAENHSSANGKIKSIDINTGEVRDLVGSDGESHVGAYSNIQMDNVNKRLYIGDDVSDSIFVVDLVTHTMSELVFGPVPIDPTLDEEN
ncbi:MAG: hypothetical protein RL497_899 [Pseudomonadota bacterium]|jgi:hypothetical protein